jgi:hypothetical protein
LRVVVRETLSEDLMERLIIDILGVAEGLMGTFVFLSFFPLFAASSSPHFLSFLSSSFPAVILRFLVLITD